MTDDAPDPEQPALDARWRSAVDARVLFRVAALAHSRQDLVRAACACARLALERSSDEPLLEAALARTEAWTRGEASWEEVQRACEEVIDDLDGSESDASNAVLSAAGAIEAPELTIDCADAAARALSSDEGVVINPSAAHLAPKRERFTMPAALAKLADVVRAALPQPDAKALRDAMAKR